MNRGDIIRMAQEAGMHRSTHNLASNPVQYRYSYDGYEENLERFAALVAEREREACAKVCNEVTEEYRGTAWGKAAESIGDICTAAIRARGEA